MTPAAHTPLTLVASVGRWRGMRSPGDPGTGTAAAGGALSRAPGESLAVSARALPAAGARVDDAADPSVAGMMPSSRRYSSCSGG